MAAAFLTGAVPQFLSLSHSWGPPFPPEKLHSHSWWSRSADTVGPCVPQAPVGRNEGVPESVQGKGAIRTTQQPDSSNNSVQGTQYVWA